MNNRSLRCKYCDSYVTWVDSDSICSKCNALEVIQYKKNKKRISMGVCRICGKSRVDITCTCELKAKAAKDRKDALDKERYRQEYQRYVASSTSPFVVTLREVTRKGKLGILYGSREVEEKSVVIPEPPPVIVTGRKFRR